MRQTAPSARRFVTLRASANNVIRKLEVHKLLAHGLNPLRGMWEVFIANRNRRITDYKWKGEDT